MGRADRAKEAFRACEGTFSFLDFEAILRGDGYEPVRPAGRTGGSRRRFVNRESGHVIMLHKPHDDVMQPGMVRRLRRELMERGVL